MQGIELFSLWNLFDNIFIKNLEITTGKLAHSSLLIAPSMGTNSIKTSEYG